MHPDSSTEDTLENGLYEVAFHILSSVSESDAPAELAKVTEIVSQQGGTVKSSEGPMLRGLAYDMRRSENGRNVPYSNAYFGSVVFEAPTATVAAIRLAVESLPSMLRVFVVSLSKDALLPRERKVTGRIDAEKFRTDKGAAPVAVSEGELDKSIEKMVTE